jgi:hypothetical protein
MAISPSEGFFRPLKRLSCFSVFSLSRTLRAAALADPALQNKPLGDVRALDLGFAAEQVLKEFHRAFFRESWAADFRQFIIQ